MIFIISQHILPFIIEIKTVIGEFENTLSIIKPVNQVIPSNQMRIKEELSRRHILLLNSSRYASIAGVGQS